MFTLRKALEAGFLEIGLLFSYRSRPTHAGFFFRRDALIADTQAVLIFTGVAGAGFFFLRFFAFP